MNATLMTAVGFVYLCAPPPPTIGQGGEGIIWAFVLAHTYVVSSLKASNI